MTVAVYDSFTDVCEQHDPALDGWDGINPKDRRTLVGLAPAPPRFLMSTLGLLAPARSIVVPYMAVGQGDESPYVYAVKRAWARSRGRGRLTQLMAKPLDVRRRWGPQFSEEFGASDYTKLRHQKLAPFFDALALDLVRQATAVSKRDLKIAKQIGWLNALYNRRTHVAYSQVRPSQLGSADRITRADCSGSIAGACDWAGILPEVDWRYTNTWIQITFGRPVATVRDALPGDVFLYGSPSHEALYLGDGMVWSFGSYPIKILRHDYRHDRRAIRRFLP